MIRAATAVALLLCGGAAGAGAGLPAVTRPSSARVRYAVQLSAADRARSAPRVRIEVRDAPLPLTLIFPAWLPGAYELRWFGRDVRELAAETAEGRALTVTRMSPTRIVVSGHARGELVRIRYRTSAELLSDDGADVDAEHAYLNPGAIVPKVLGLERAAHELTLEELPTAWRVLGAQRQLGPVSFAADDYASLVDGPIEASARVVIAELVIEGSRFVIAIDREDGAAPPREVPRSFIEDVRKIVAAERAIAGPLPFTRYLLLVHLSDRPTRTVALEHAASTSIIAPTDALSGDGYRELRHMVAHEVFHAWNARRLVPAELVDWNPESPQPSRALWITEGLTEHASLVALVRAGLVSRSSMLDALSEEASRAHRAEQAGLSLEEQALLAFSAPTELVADGDAYYAIGHLVSLALVAELLQRTGGKVGLAELLAALLPPLGAPPRALDTATLGAIADVLAPPQRGEPALSTLLEAWATRPFSIDALRPSLERLGVRLRRDPSERHVEVGVVVEGAQAEVRAVEAGSMFSRAGVQVGDRLVSLDGAPVTMASILTLARRSEERTLSLDLERLGRRVRLTLRPREPSGEALRVELATDGSVAQKKQRARLFELPAP